MTTSAASAGTASASTAVLIFDGECGLCTRSVRWLQRHARRGAALEFVARGSAEAAAECVVGAGAVVTGAGADSMVFISGGRASIRSTAALRLLPHLRWPWRLLAVFWLVPRPLRDRVYDFVAHRRYRWFGRSGG